MPKRKFESVTHIITPKRNKVERVDIFTSLFDQDYQSMNLSPPNVRSDRLTTAMLTKICMDRCQNDVADIRWWENGTPHDGKVQAVSELSVDNFILAHHMNEIEIHQNKYLRGREVPLFVKNWLADNGIQSASIKKMHMTSDRDMSYGRYQPIPHVRYKVAVADAPIDMVFQLFQGGSRQQLHCVQVGLYNIDIKQDFACTVTDQVFAVSKQLADRIFGLDIFTYDKQVNQNCVSLIRYDGRIRAKIYNKFSECITSPGISNGKVGCNVGFWINSPIESLQKSILDSRTQDRGLSRIEVTFHDLPTRTEYLDIFEKFKTIFLTATNYTPIAKQWQMLKPQHSVALYDCFSGEYMIARWKDSRTGTMNGIHGRAKSLLSFVQRVKLCTFSQVPIDVYLIDSDVSYCRTIHNKAQREAHRCTFDVEYSLKNKSDFSDVSRSNWQFKQQRMKRLGCEKRTLFIRGDHLHSTYYTNRIEYAPEDAGLKGNDLIIPGYQVRINSNKKVVNVELCREDDDNKEIVIIDGMPPDGEYGFIKSFRHRTFLPGHDMHVKPLCIELTNGKCYACYGELSKWSSKFETNQPFQFLVCNGRLRLPTDMIDYKGIPKSLAKLQPGKMYALYRVSSKTMYGKERMIVQFSSQPYVGYTASLDLECMIKNGKKCFFASTIGFDSQRNKTMIMTTV